MVVNGYVAEAIIFGVFYTGCLLILLQQFFRSRQYVARKLPVGPVRKVVHSILLVSIILNILRSVDQEAVFGIYPFRVAMLLMMMDIASLCTILFCIVYATLLAYYEITTRGKKAPRVYFILRNLLSVLAFVLGFAQTIKAYRAPNNNFDIFYFFTPVLLLIGVIGMNVSFVELRKEVLAVAATMVGKVQLEGKTDLQTSMNHLRRTQIQLTLFALAGMCFQLFQGVLNARSPLTFDPNNYSWSFSGRRIAQAFVSLALIQFSWLRDVNEAGSSFGAKKRTDSRTPQGKNSKGSRNSKEAALNMAGVRVLSPTVSDANNSDSDHLSISIDNQPKFVMRGSSPSDRTHIEWRGELIRVEEGIEQEDDHEVDSQAPSSGTEHSYALPSPQTASDSGSASDAGNSTTSASNNTGSAVFGPIASSSVLLVIDNSHSHTGI